VRWDAPAPRYDWTDRYPAIAAAAAKLRAKSFTLDGEAVVAGADGVAMFNALHRRHEVTDAMLYAFDLLNLDGKHLRPLPLVLAQGDAGRPFLKHHLKHQPHQRSGAGERQDQPTKLVHV
jgi:hypothetical protein